MAAGSEEQPHRPGGRAGILEMLHQTERNDVIESPLQAGFRFMLPKRRAFEAAGSCRDFVEPMNLVEKVFLGENRNEKTSADHDRC